MDDIKELSLRLDRMEARYRRLRAIFGLALIGGFALIGMAQTTSTPPPATIGRSQAETRSVVPNDGKLRAEGFILVDDKGAERASLVTDGGGSVFLVLFDKNGKPRADMQVGNYGPSVNFYDPDSKTRLVMGATPLVASHVNVDGQVEKNTPSSIVMFDPAGKLVWRTP